MNDGNTILFNSSEHECKKKKKKKKKKVNCYYDVAINTCLSVSS